MQVSKFGGTSMADHRTWLLVVGLLKSMDNPVAVVSATARTTRELVRAAELASLGEMGQALTMIRGIRDRHIEIVLSFAKDALATDTLATDAQFADTTHSNNTAPQGSSEHSNSNPIDINPSIQYIESQMESLRHDLESVATTGTLNAEILDRIAGTGELLSSRLFADCAGWAGLATRFMDAREIVKTDAVFGAANPDEARSASAINPLKTLLNEGQIPVIGGYIGEAPDGRPTTLGFEGSDVTATFLGALLGAESVTIWTDVDGVYSCDPRVVPNARRLDTLTFAQAEKMASCGAKVLHPNTLKPVSGRGIPVWVRNLFAPARGGTLISGGTSSGTSSGTPSGTHSSIPSESPSESPSTLAFRSEVRVDGDTKKPGQRIPGQRIPGQRVSVMGLSLQRWERVRDHAARVAEDFRYSEKDQFLSAWIPEEEMENRIQILYHLLCS